MKQATIRTQGKQLRVKEGDIVTVDRFPGSNAGDVVTIDTVLTLGQGDEVKIGRPLVEGASVTAKVVENKRGNKIVIFKKKRRKGYELKKGHRQELSVIEIEKIEG